MKFSRFIASSSSEYGKGFCLNNDLELDDCGQLKYVPSIDI
jgi:hypothetical protein